MGTNEKFEVVISGVAGLYPECDDVNTLWESLMNKEDLVTVDSRRWAPGEFEVPAGVGKVRNPEKFDLQFFGIHRRLGERMDPYCRLMCEQAFRAICDAGVNPSCLDGTNAACIMTSYMSEPELDLGNDVTNQGVYSVLATSRTMQANRISYFLNLVGPSFQLDWQGHGGIQGLQMAYDLISTGACAAAIVGSCSLIYKPEVSFHFKTMGKLSDDSVTRSFSADANGYARSEGCVSLFLQRKDHARRIYGTVLAADCLCFGAKLNPFTELPVSHFDNFLADVYKKAKVDPSEVSYVEAYGSASKTLDAKELNAFSKIMLKNRKDPLLIGSIKSNVGHTEGCSSLVGLTKVLLALNNGVIPPNIHYKEPNPDVPDLVNGRIKVVTEPTPLKGDIVALNEISNSGTAGHLILKRYNPTVPSIVDSKPQERLPLLITMSGRVEESMKANLMKLNSLGVNENFAVLANKLYKGGIKSHAYKGYTVLNGSPNKYNMVSQIAGGNEARPIWFMYSGMGSQWPTMAKSLMALPIFAKAIRRCHEVLLPKGVDLLKILTVDDPKMFDTILNSFVGIAAVQIGLTDVLKSVGVEPDGIIGHSVGELGCAYADGCLTAEEMILSAHARGRASTEAELIEGMMAAVGAGYKTIKNSLPETIEVACHNSKDSCTLSGPTEDMTTFIAQLKAKGMFAKLVNVANIAYHSRYIKPAAPALLKYLKEIISVPKKRSSKWVSSSIPESEWGSELARYSGAEYHTNNLLSSVLFEEASTHIPSNAIVIEIAPHGLLQAIVKKSMPQATHVPLTSRFDPDNFMFMLDALGKLYIAGIPVSLDCLYPTATCPVSPGTAAISPFLDWLRVENFEIVRVTHDPDEPSPMCKYVNIEKEQQCFERIASHKINKTIAVPLNFYLDTMLDLFYISESNDKQPLVIQNLVIGNPVEIQLTSSTELRFKLLPGVGDMVVNNTINDEVVVEGKFKSIDEKSLGDLSPVEPVEKADAISRDSMLSLLGAKGVEKDPAATTLDNIHIFDGSAKATVQWNGNLGDFIMNVITLVEFYATRKGNVLKLFHSAGEINIDLPRLNQNSTQTHWIEYVELERKVKGEGFEMSLIECRAPNLDTLTKVGDVWDFKLPQFVPYVNGKSQTIRNHVVICSQLVQENSKKAGNSSIKIFEIGYDAALHAAVKEISEVQKNVQSIEMTSFSSEEEFFKSGSTLLLLDNIWLVMPSLPTKDLVSMLSVVSSGYILMPKTKNGLFKNSNVKIVYEALVNNDWYALYSVRRKPAKLNYEVVSLKGDYLENLSNQLEKIKESEDEAEKAIFLCGQVDSLMSVQNILEETENVPNPQHLRYWLSVGQSENFDPQNAYFKTQIERNVKINISLDGTWGSVKLLSANVSENQSSNERSSTFIYPLSAVATPQNIIALGLNPADDPSGGLGVYDYVSSTSMGVGTFDPHSKMFVADKVLSWPKPNYWTAEESATVPFLYSMASYIIHQINNCGYVDDKTILINQALTPLSQALISLSLYENLTIYTTVYGETEKNELLKLFPELNRDFIFDCSSSAFFVDVLRLTKGVYKVVNNFDDPQMVAPCAKCVMPLGTLIYVNQTLMNSKAKMGMSIFMDEIASWGATSDILMTSSKEVVNKIKQNISEALAKRAIKPIRLVKTLAATTINTEAISLLKSNGVKYVVNTKGVKVTNEHRVYIKDESKCHIVVEGKVPMDLSFEIVEWLLKRGSKRVIIFTRTIHPLEANAIKLQTLRDHYKSSEIDVRSTNQISSKANVDKFVLDCKSPEMIFFLGSGLKEKIELFDVALSSRAPSCNMICIGKGGEIVCERRNKKALPALYVRCSLSTLENINLPNYLDDLLKNSSTISEVLVDKRVVQGGSPSGLKDGLQHIPNSLSELRELFLRSPQQATFVEMKTKSLRKEFSHELYPFFMIPGLQPKRLRQLAEELFSTAFEARLPSDVTDLDQMAADLTHQLLGFPQNMYTLVGEGWGGILALQIAAKLDAQSKIVSVILVDGTPADINRWAGYLLKNNSVLIDHYLHNIKTIPDFETMPWADKVREAVNRSGLRNEDEKIVLEKSFQSLRNRLQSVVSAKPPPNKLSKSYVHVFELPSQKPEEDGLNEYTDKTPTYHLVEAESAEKMTTETAAPTINSLLLFEYREAAYPPIEEYINQQFVKKPDWRCTKLTRLTS